MKDNDFTLFNHKVRTTYNTFHELLSDFTAQFWHSKGEYGIMDVVKFGRGKSPLLIVGVNPSPYLFQICRINVKPINDLDAWVRVYSGEYDPVIFTPYQIHAYNEYCQELARYLEVSFGFLPDIAIQNVENIIVTPEEPSELSGDYPPFERMPTIDEVSEQVYKTLVVLTPNRYEFRRDREGNYILYSIYLRDGTLLGRYAIQPGGPGGSVYSPDDRDQPQEWDRICQLIWIDLQRRFGALPWTPGTIETTSSNRPEINSTTGKPDITFSGLSPETLNKIAQDLSIQSTAVVKPGMTEEEAKAARFDAMRSGNLTGYLDTTPLQQAQPQEYTYHRKPGRPHLSEDVWAWEEVNEKNRSPKDVYLEWEIKIESRNLADPMRQFKRIIKPGWNKK